MHPETLNTFLATGTVKPDSGKQAMISVVRPAGSSGGKSASAGSAFSAAYNKVAYANKSASRGADAETSSKETKTATEAGDSKGSGAPAQAGLQEESDPAHHHALDTPSTPDSNQSAPDDSAASGGSAVIRQALLTISQALHLPADPDLEELLITGAEGTTAQQLSDILATLKNISSVLGEAASKGTVLDTGNSTIDAQASGNLAALLDSQIFKIELGASMLGVGETGSEPLPQVDGCSGANIPQAIDPSALSMSAAQLQSLMSGSAPSQEELQALVEKIAALCGSDAQPDGGEGESKDSGSEDSGADAAFGALAASMGDATQPAAIMDNAATPLPPRAATTASCNNSPTGCSRQSAREFPKSASRYNPNRLVRSSCGYR